MSPLYVVAASEHQAIKNIQVGLGYYRRLSDAKEKARIRTEDDRCNPRCEYRAWEYKIDVTPIS